MRALRSRTVDGKSSTSDDCNLSLSKVTKKKNRRKTKKSDFYLSDSVFGDTIACHEELNDIQTFIDLAKKDYDKSLFSDEENLGGTFLQLDNSVPKSCPKINITSCLKGDSSSGGNCITIDDSIDDIKSRDTTFENLIEFISHSKASKNIHLDTSIKGSNKKNIRRMKRDIYELNLNENINKGTQNDISVQDVKTTKSTFNDTYEKNLEKKLNKSRRRGSFETISDKKNKSTQNDTIKTISKKKVNKSIQRSTETTPKEKNNENIRRNTFVTIPDEKFHKNLRRGTYDKFSDEKLNKSTQRDPFENVPDEMTIKTLRRDTYEKNLDEQYHTNSQGDTFEKNSEKKYNTSSRRNTLEITNQSGQWIIEDISNNSEIEEINFIRNTKSPERITNHPKSIINILNATFDSPSKSMRKRWVKFDTAIVDSPLLRNTTYSDIKSSKSLLTSSPLEKSLINAGSTPGPNKKSIEKKKQNTSVIIVDSMTKSNKKNIKPITMPNFALIHQKAFEKMESLKEYSERKQVRAKQLMSTEKKSKTEINKENKKNVIKDLFGNVQSYNRFGFRKPTAKLNNDIEPQPFKFISCKPSNLLISKSKENMLKPICPKFVTSNKSLFSKNIDQKPEIGKIVKPCAFTKSNAIAVANKTKTADKLADRVNRRGELKGVRMNRRFELLMQMRNK